MRLPDPQTFVLLLIAVVVVAVMLAVELLYVRCIFWPAPQPCQNGGEMAQAWISEAITLLAALLIKDWKKPPSDPP